MVPHHVEGSVEVYRLLHMASGHYLRKEVVVVCRVIAAFDIAPILSTCCT